MTITLSRNPPMIIYRTLEEVARMVYVSGCFWLMANVPQETLPMSPYKLFVICAIVSMVAGLGSLLRSKEDEVTARMLLSHALNMGTCGAGLAMILYSMLHPRENLEWLIIGFAGVFSLGGMGSIDWAVDSVKSIAKKTLGQKNE